MHVINAINVRDALPSVVNLLMQWGIPEQTRNGAVLAATDPVCIHYLQPKQHVLLSPIRDANPFFHLIEAMWMLAGRQDGTFLDYYVKDFSKRFGNNGIIMDAYGYRWRHGLRFDQLDEIVAQLRKDHTTRQCVLQIWGAGEQRELMSYSAKPCNLIATFRIVEDKLDMSVFNRSNDAIWGCCGANAVHFPILQEYIAGRIGIEIGHYWQISTNLHLYREHIEMLDERFNKYELEHHYRDSRNNEPRVAWSLKDNYAYQKTIPLMEHPLTFDADLQETMIWLESIQRGEEFYSGNITNRFLRNVVMPMAVAHHYYKTDEKQKSLDAIYSVHAEDWQLAGVQWLNRRFDERIRRRHESTVQS